MRGGLGNTEFRFGQAEVDKPVGYAQIPAGERSSSSCMPSIVRIEHYKREKLSEADLLRVSLIFVQEEMEPVTRETMCQEE